jgi:UDP-N-acetylglucosamine transferase subunit ALG13
MVVITVGTNEQPFDRLVAAAAGLPDDADLVVQYGSSTIRSGPGRWCDFLPFDELEQLMRAATAVVCHAGVGSIVLARRCGHRPIVLARRLHLGEAVDDHQLQLARRLDAAGFVRLVEDADQLATTLSASEALDAGTGLELPGASALADELRVRFAEFGTAPAAPLVA